MSLGQTNPEAEMSKRLIVIALLFALDTIIKTSFAEKDAKILSECRRLLGSLFQNDEPTAA